MGNSPSQYPSNPRPVYRVPAPPRPSEPPTPQPTPGGYGGKQRAPRPPERVPSYKNPRCLVLPKDAPNGILKSRNGPRIPAEDYFSDDDDTDNELDPPEEDFEIASGATERSENRRPRSQSGPLLDRPYKQGNYTPNGEVIQRERSQTMYVEPNGEIPNVNSRSGLQKLPNGNYQRSVPHGGGVERVDRIINANRKFENGLNEHLKDSPRGVSNESRVTFVNASQKGPELGAVVKPFPRRQKGRAPPPPRPPPPNMEPPAPPAPMVPSVVKLQDAENKPIRRLTQPRQSLHEQLQEDIIKAAVARQGREPVQPPKIEKPKSGEEKFRDQLIQVCKRIETYPGESDVDGHTTGRDSEWETTYDPRDYKPKATSKFLVKSNVSRAQQPRQQQTDSPRSVEKPSPRRGESPRNQPMPQSSSSSKTSRQRSQSVDSVLGSSINLISTKLPEPEDEWTPDQDLNDDLDILDVDQPVTDARRPESAVFGPSMRMNTQESSMGSVKMYRSRSTDQGRSETPSRFRHRHSDGSVQSKSSIKSFKDSIRSAFSSIGTSTAARKDRKSVKGYFEQPGYRYGPDVRPVMFYQPHDPYYQNYYPMPYHPPQALSPTMHYGGPGPWYEDPYRMYPPRPMPMQPVMITDGMHRRSMSMEEMQYGAQYGQMYVDGRPDDRGRSKSRSGSKSRNSRESSRNREYGGSWSSLKDDIQYDGGSISRSWRKLKARGRGRSKSRESLDDWNDGHDKAGREVADDSSDDEIVPAPMAIANDNSRQEASRRYQEAMQRGAGRRRSHGKKNGGVSSSSDENKPPTKILRDDGLPPTGPAKYRGRYRKRGSEVDMDYNL